MNPPRLPQQPGEFQALKEELFPEVTKCFSPLEMDERSIGKMETFPFFRTLSKNVQLCGSVAVETVV